MSTVYSEETKERARQILEHLKAMFDITDTNYSADSIYVDRLALKHKRGFVLAVIDEKRSGYLRQPTGELVIVVAPNEYKSHLRLNAKRRFPQHKNGEFAWDKILSYIKGYIDDKLSRFDLKAEQDQARQKASDALRDAGIGFMQHPGINGSFMTTVIGPGGSIRTSWDSYSVPNGDEVVIEPSIKINMAIPLEALPHLVEICKILDAKRE